MGEDLGFKVEAIARQRSECVSGLEVDEVLWSLGGAQFLLAAGAPAVWFGAQIFDFADRRIRVEEGGNIGRQGAGRQFIDHAMAFTAPSEAGNRGKEGENKRAGSEAAGKNGAHSDEYSGAFQAKKVCRRLDVGKFCALRWQKRRLFRHMSKKLLLAEVTIVY